MPVTINYFLRVAIIAILLGCLAKMPYGYYQFVRLSMFIVFLALAYQEYEKKRWYLTILCTGFALLFNPIYRVYFAREIWNSIDVAVACCVGVWLLLDFVQERNNK